SFNLISAFQSKQFFYDLVSRRRTQYARNLCAANRSKYKDPTDTRRKTDKLARVRGFFDSLDESCQKLHTSGDQLTIDKKLDPFRGT
ncbi:hypothetical protein AVEN_72994-1, partial [Araneus ventricosus]